MKKKSGIGCLLYIILVIFNLIVGGLSIDYILSWFSKDIPFIGDAVIGLFLGEFSVPIAIVGWVLRLCGIF